jgi:hypothetical protein
LVINPYDEEDLKRIINFPEGYRRDTTVQNSLTWPLLPRLSHLDIIPVAASTSSAFQPGNVKKLEAFSGLILSLRNGQRKLCLYKGKGEALMSYPQGLVKEGLPKK